MMTLEQIDAAHAAKGWRYDVSKDDFFAGNRRLGYQKILAVVPGMTLDELASYQEAQWGKSPKRREVAKSLAEYVARKAGQSDVARSK